MSNPLVIVDLSHHNPEPDWEKLQAGGVIGVILKATEGTSYIDPTFGSRRQMAKQAGLACASYHFLKRGNARGQMMHYLDVVGPVPGERVIIDYEASGLTLNELEDAVEALARQPLNLQITVYSGHLIKDQLGSDKNVLLSDFTSLWIAQYGTTVKWPTGTWPVWSLWQFTDKANVPGISAPVDGNRFNGSVENAYKWLSPAVQPVEPVVVPVPIRPVVEIDIRAPAGVDIKVNGQLLNAA
jgi:lysozyme